MFDAMTSGEILLTDMFEAENARLILLELLQANYLPSQGSASVDVAIQVVQCAYPYVKEADIRSTLSTFGSLSEPERSSVTWRIRSSFEGSDAAMAMQ